MNKNDILQCLDLSDWSEDSSPEGSDDSDEDIIFEVSNLTYYYFLYYDLLSNRSKNK